MVDEVSKCNFYDIYSTNQICFKYLQKEKKTVLCFQKQREEFVSNIATWTVEKTKFHTSIYKHKDLLQPNSWKLSVLLTFYINSTLILRLGNLASREASIYYTALRI